MTSHRSSAGLCIAAWLLVPVLVGSAAAGVLTPFGVPDPDYENSSMQLWLRGDRGVTTGGTFTWADQSNQGNDASQGTGSAQPSQAGAINGHATINFDGSNDNLAGALGQTLSSDSFTAFMVLESDNAVGDGHHPFDGESADRFAFASYSSSTEKYFIQFQSAAVGTEDLSNDPILFSAVGTPVSDNTVTQRIDGTVNAVGDYSATTAIDSYRLGARYDGASSHLDGRIAEVIVYDRPLSAGEENAVGDYLQNKYNISGAFTPNNYVDHVGRTDPTTEQPAWTLSQGGGTSVGPGTETRASGTFDYWFTDDNSSASGSTASYAYDLTAQQVLFPWSVRTRLRIEDASGLDQTIRVNDDTERWSIWFLENEIQTVTSSGFTHLFDIDTKTDYNLFEMLYTPETAGVKSLGDRVDFLVNGQLVGSLTRALTEDRPGHGMNISFGAMSSGGQGEGHWNFVDMRAVPEPGSLLIWSLLAGLGIAATRPRRTRK